MTPGDVQHKKSTVENLQFNAPQKPHPNPTVAPTQSDIFRDEVTIIFDHLIDIKFAFPSLFMVLIYSETNHENLISANSRYLLITGHTSF